MKEWRQANIEYIHTERTNERTDERANERMNERTQARAGAVRSRPSERQSAPVTSFQMDVHVHVSECMCRQ